MIKHNTNNNHQSLDEETSERVEPKVEKSNLVEKKIDWKINLHLPKKCCWYCAYKLKETHYKT